MNSLVQKVISKMNISMDEYYELTKDIDISDLEDPSSFKNIDIAVTRIKEAIKNNEKIMIYGDYDCDGISATSILYLAFKKLNYDVGYYIPSRYKDGYGINENMVDIIAQKGYKLIITVDNGVSQMEALKKAKNLHIDVILTDHHEILNDIPPCYTIIHPSLKENKDYLPECGAYVAFMISHKLLGYVDEYLLTLASLATISDMMPLRLDNRNIVKLGIKSLQNNKFSSLMKLSDYPTTINEKTFSFNIAPKVNSLGRIIKDTKVNRMVTYLTSSSNEEQNMLLQYINNVVLERKTVTDQAFKKIDLSNHQNDNVIVEVFDDVCEGVIGLVAQKVLMECKKPCVCLCYGEEGILKGSCRSLIGFNIAEALNALDDLLLAHGGHAQAGGLSLSKENLPLFKERINNLAHGIVLKEKEKN
ncbi:MAG: DHH family phosphoesterase, partial [Bacilli bacterium]